MTPPAEPFQLAFQKVQALVQTFQTGSKHYLAAAYQEQEARQDFIDKFWTALGWDVTHDDQTNPYAQEVKVERGIPMAAAPIKGEARKQAYQFYGILYRTRTRLPAG